MLYKVRFGTEMNHGIYCKPCSFPPLTLWKFLLTSAGLVSETPPGLVSHVSLNLVISPQRPWLPGTQWLSLMTRLHWAELTSPGKAWLHCLMASRTILKPFLVFTITHLHKLWCVGKESLGNMLLFGWGWGLSHTYTHTMKGRRTNLSSPRLGGNDTFCTADSHNWDYLWKPLSANLSADIEV